MHPLVWKDMQYVNLSTELCSEIWKTSFILFWREQRKIIIFNFVDTPRNFIIAKLSIRKPGSSSVVYLQS